MANTRFSVSADPAVHRAIKARAQAAGMDVPACMVAAATAQMAADDAASAAFAPLTRTTPPRWRRRRTSARSHCRCPTT